MPFVKTLTLAQNLLPPRLTGIHKPPQAIHYKGTNPLELLAHPCVAIVGSRKVDPYGARVTKTLAGELARRGVVVVSGLALGVDAIAHRSAIENGGLAMAVLPCGIETIYPKTNALLALDITNNGCLISEHEGEFDFRKHDLLIRNRLVSALADVVVITQAATRSGSLNTARHALEQGKTVMAVPGDITNPLCDGTNNLLRQGATPLLSSDDVLNELGITPDVIEESDAALLAENAQEHMIITLLGQGLADGEALMSASSMQPGEFNVHLTMLELRGIIAPLGANKWTLRRR